MAGKVSGQVSLFRRVARATTARHTFADECASEEDPHRVDGCSSRTDTPSHSRGADRARGMPQHPPRKVRAWGMPGAQCTRSLVCAWDARKMPVIWGGRPSKIFFAKGLDHPNQNPLQQIRFFEQSGYRVMASRKCSCTIPCRPPSNPASPRETALTLHVPSPKAPYRCGISQAPCPRRSHRSPIEPV